MNSFRQVPPLIRYIWLSFFFGIAGVVLFFCMIAWGWLGELPSREDLSNPRRNMATEVISTDGEVIGRYYLENRSDVHFLELPIHLRQALLATEDIRFYDHQGVDVKALFGVVLGQLRGGDRGGGSTITQQLAKNLFPREDLSTPELILRKFKEWVMSVRLERAFTKDEILALYLNTVSFSDNAYGIRSAAYTYFGKKVDSLYVEEAAVLVGMLKAPSFYNPRRNPERSTRRRNTVLAQMRKYDFLTDEQFDSISKMPLNLQFHPNVVAQGAAPYFREYLRLWLKKYLKEHPKPDGKPYDLYRDGLKIYVTIDSRLQAHAEAAQKEHLKEWQKVFFTHWKNRDPWRDFPREWKAILSADPQVKAMRKAGKSDGEIEAALKKPRPMRIFSWDGEKDTLMSAWDSIRYHRMHLQNGFMAVDPSSGFIRCWVGGIDYRYFQYDHVNPATKRQIGSTFKPFIYTVAIRDKGYAPCFEVPNTPVTFEAGDPRFHLLQDWTPKNSDGKYGGSYTLKAALANSINTVTAFLMHGITTEAVRDLARLMGIESDIPLQPSICLGTADISLFEMVGAYTTFANRGVYSAPYFVTRITDRNGNVIADFSAPQREVLDEKTCYTMVEIMRHVVAGGTAQRLHYRYQLPGDIIGKTGTTQNNSDGWFMGAYPDLVAGSWVGCDDRYLRFNSTNLGQGASTALPVWALFFQKVIADSSLLQEVDVNKRFAPPTDGSEAAIVNCRGQKSVRNAVDAADEYE